MSHAHYQALHEMRTDFDDVQHDEEDGEDRCQHVENSWLSRVCKARTTVAATVLVIEVFHVLIVFAIARYFWGLENNNSRLEKAGSLIAYHHLSDYSQSFLVGDDPPDNVLPSLGNEAIWARLRPNFGGIVKVPTDEAQAYSLPASGILDPIYPDQSIYQIAAFHQMHCLGLIRDALLPPDIRNSSSSATVADQRNHTLHCVEYLRQMLLCNADTTLDPSDDFQRFGVGSQRKCRDWTALWDWWDANKFLELGEFWKLNNITD